LLEHERCKRVQGSSSDLIPREDTELAGARHTSAIASKAGVFQRKRYVATVCCQHVPNFACKCSYGVMSNDSGPKYCVSLHITKCVGNDVIRRRSPKPEDMW